MRARRSPLPLLLAWGAVLALGAYVRPGIDEPTFGQTLLLPVWGALVAVALWRSWRALRPRVAGDRRAEERRRGARRAHPIGR